MAHLGEGDGVHAPPVMLPMGAARVMRMMAIGQAQAAGAATTGAIDGLRVRDLPRQRAYQRRASAGPLESIDLFGRCEQTHRRCYAWAQGPGQGGTARGT